MLIKFLLKLYQLDESQNFYLEGGAALSLIYHLDRKFSNDLDFTLPDDLYKEVFKKACKNIIQDILPKYKIKFYENRIEILLGEKAIFHIDYYVAPPINCLYSQSTLEGQNINVHSIEDIFVEKLCCLVSRCEIRDIHDLHIILDSFRDLDPYKIISYYKLKSRVKKLQFKDITSFLINKEKIVSKFKRKFGKELTTQEFNKICTFLLPTRPQ